MKSLTKTAAILAIAIGTLCAVPNEWTNVGPDGGPIRSLAIDPQNPATIYAATSGGIFKSEDAGASWSNAGLIGLDVAGLVMRTGSPATLFAWTQGSNLYLFKSADGGATWNGVWALPAGCCLTVAFDAQDANTVYALTPASLFKSTDGGTNWTQTPGLPHGFYFVAVSADPHMSGALYAGVLGSDSSGRQVAEVFKSMDGGANWNKANSGLRTIPSNAELYTPSVLPPAPFLFSFSGDGKGQGAVWHATTGQIASAENPATSGEVLSMYTNGLVEDGLISPQIVVGNRLAETLFFGGAPGYPGFFQVNFRVPTLVAPGPPRL